MTQTLAAPFAYDAADPPAENLAVRDVSTFQVNVMIALVGCILTMGVVFLLYGAVLHWSLLPLLICGTLIGADAVAWARGQIDLFDPKGVIGVVGVHFFFLSALLQLVWDAPLLGRMPNPGPWLGLMGVLNAVCIIIYFLTRRLGERGTARVNRYYWQVNPASAHAILPPAIVFCAAAQVYVLIRVGGFAGMIAIHEDVEGGVAYFGLGLFRMLGQALPMLLALMATVMRLSGGYRRSTLITIGVVLVVILSIQFMLSGFGGSRSSMAYGVFAVIGMLHFFWRRFTVRHAVLALIPFIMFLYVYAFYKDAGSRAFGLLTGETTVAALEHRTERTIPALLLGDLSRADLQAFQLAKLQTDPTAYDLRRGRTYYTAVTPLIPYWIWPGKPKPEKIIAGADMAVGRGFYKPNHPYRKSTRIYGLAGEAMLNFGWTAVPFAYAIWGFLLGRYRRRFLGRRVGDARLLVAALFSLLCFHGFFNDVDNLLAFVFWKMLLVVIVVRLISVRIPLGEGVGMAVGSALPNGDVLSTRGGVRFHGS